MTITAAQIKAAAPHIETMFVVNKKVITVYGPGKRSERFEKIHAVLKTWLGENKVGQFDYLMSIDNSELDHHFESIAA